MEKLSSGKQIKILDHEKFDYLIQFLKKYVAGKKFVKKKLSDYSIVCGVF